MVATSEKKMELMLVVFECVCVNVVQWICIDICKCLCECKSMYGAYGVYVCIRALMSLWMCACVCVRVRACVCERESGGACVQACGWVCDNKSVTRCAQKGFITIFCWLRLILFLRTWSHSTVSTVSTPAKKLFTKSLFFYLCKSSTHLLIDPFIWQQNQIHVRSDWVLVSYW